MHDTSLCCIGAINIATFRLFQFGRFVNSLNSETVHIFFHIEFEIGTYWHYSILCDSFQYIYSY